MTSIRFSTPTAALMLALLSTLASAQEHQTFDVAQASVNGGDIMRVLGARGEGRFGVPVAGGFDVDGDDAVDFAIGFMTANVDAMFRAGEVNLLFGDGDIRGEFDSLVPQERILRILGTQPQETTGSEIWMDDVTGDGLGDLLIARQNHDPGSRLGAGAITIIPGSAALRTFAAGLQPLDLAAPPSNLNVTTIVGANAGERFGIWLRTADVDGDGTSDLVAAADQRSNMPLIHSGVGYAILGGAYLGDGSQYDLALLTGSNLATRVAEITSPAPGNHYHFGATIQTADLDGNGRAEIIIAETLNRSGAQLPPVGGTAHGGGVLPRGRAVVVWDDNYPTPWPERLIIDLTTPPGSVTRIDGGASSVNFGEELLAGLDYDDSGMADLFVGDLTARSAAGDGWILFDIENFKNQTFTIDARPPGLSATRILGQIAGGIGADTAAHGDFNADSIGDVAFCTPKDAPLGRTNAGSVMILHGQSGAWPATIDTNNPMGVSTTLIQGAKIGDILCYSGADGDANDDGATDLILNEMTGDGSQTNDVGNLLIVNGLISEYRFGDGFEGD